MTQKLILLRHASRNHSQNELNSVGLEQAESRAKYFSQNLSSQGLKILSSSKKRCVQTAQAIASNLGLGFEKSEDIEERRANEDSKCFEKRVTDSLKKSLRKDFETLIICSHSDWLFIAMRDWAELRISLDEACWAEFQKQANEEWILRDLIATESDFKKIYS